MSQPNQRRARSIEEIRRIEEAARQLYLATGGADIDETLAPLRLTMQSYSAQMQEAYELADNGMPYDPRQRTGWGPPVSPYEARMTAAKISTLIRQREQKMAQCRAVIEEGERFEREEHESKPAPQAQEAAPPATPKAVKALPAEPHRVTMEELLAKQVRPRELAALTANRS